MAWTYFHFRGVARSTFDRNLVNLADTLFLVVARADFFAIKSRARNTPKCFTSPLHSDSRTKPLKPREEPHVFSIFAIQKAILRHDKRLANERLLPVLVTVSNAIQVREI